MNNLKLAHELGQLIAKRKVGEIGEFSYVCLRSGEERRGRGEIIELVKEKNKEGWEKVRKYGGEGEDEKEFEGKVRKLVAKLPWEIKEALSTVNKAKKEEYYENLKIEEELMDTKIDMKDEMKEETDDDIKDEVKVKEEEYYENLKIEEIFNTNNAMKDEVKEETNNDIKGLEGIRLCDSMKEETLEIGQENKDDFPSNPSYQKTKRLFEKFKLCAVENKCSTFLIRFEKNVFQSWCSVLQANFGSPEEESPHGARFRKLRFTAKDTCLDNDNPESVFLTMKEKQRTLLIKAKPEHIIHLMENHFENLHNQVYPAETVVYFNKVYDKNGLELGQQGSPKRENEEPQDRMKSGSDDVDSKDKKIVASMNMNFACLSETCDKMFVKWKLCRKHILVCCGIASTKENDKQLTIRSSFKAKKQGAPFRVKSGPDDEDHQDSDTKLVGNMTFQFACLGETCEKMFVKWKPCRRHILVCCGINPTKANVKEVKNRSAYEAKLLGSQFRKGGLKNGPFPQPTEQDLVEAVETFNASLHNPVKSKHVLGHIRKLYGLGKFGRFGWFGFGTFFEFSKRHGLEVNFHEQDQSTRFKKEIPSKILQRERQAGVQGAPGQESQQEELGDETFYPGEV